MSGVLYVPIDSLDERLKELIPFGEMIVYSSRVKIAEIGWGRLSKHGHLALTIAGVAFRAEKTRFGNEIFEVYVPYENMCEFKNKGKTVEFKVSIPGKPGEIRGWKLTVERSEGEDKESFRRRQGLFGQVFENLMERRLAIYK